MVALRSGRVHVLVLLLSPEAACCCIPPTVAHHRLLLHTTDGCMPLTAAARRCPQPKCPENTKEYLGQAEEVAKEAKANKQSELW